MNTKKSWTRFVVGLAIVSIGLVLIIKANLGVSPWTVFHIGLTKYFPLTVGTAGQITGLVVIIISFMVARVKPTFATIINILLVGFLIDWLMPLVPHPTTIFMKYLYLATGIIIFGSGAGTYISAQCGTGPRDSLMMALDEKLDFKLGLIRNGIELIILVVGYFLGGPVGIGTIFTALGIGPIVEFSLNLMNTLFSNSYLQANS
ncbi:putative membrane protein [Halobacteroides halobius DSM 5150]|uniref:Putative membrane protein n=1 Tax=Halobacteroides halobius (strain ATCC 35273 / DSM 5150 / MD-1) TaxID=748449 RepID=L0K769_HALHC|nr:membrane protein [Halobacteroides halobius]AGB40841.1 putative membrane protein [Halobacteroides halobius DSM 5150]